MNDKPTFILLCGIPASGKSTWAKGYCRLNPDIIYLSSDDLRAVYGTGPEDQSVSGYVFGFINHAIEYFLKQGKTVMLDATNVDSSARKKNLEPARKAGANIIAHCFPVSLEESLRRNNLRDRKVPDDVIEKFCNRWMIPNSNEAHEIIVHNNEPVFNDILDDPTIPILSVPVCMKPI